jgi:hypothetical protein
MPVNGPSALRRIPDVRVFRPASREPALAHCRRFLFGHICEPSAMAMVHRGTGERTDDECGEAAC